MNWKQLWVSALCAAGLVACGQAEVSEPVGTTQGGLVVPQGLLGLHSPIANQSSAMLGLFPNASRRGYLVTEVFSTDNDWIPGVVGDTNRYATDGFKPVVRLDYARTGSLSPSGEAVNGATLPWTGSTGGRCLKRGADQATDVNTPEKTHRACYLNYIRTLVSQAANVHTWVIGNEMNMSEEAKGFPGSQIPAGDYAQVYREARSLIRSLSGHTADGVFVGGVSPNGVSAVAYKSGQQYLQELLYTLQPNEVDGIAIHAYGGPPNPSNPGEAMTIFRTGLPGGMGYQNQLQWIDALGYSQVPVLLTEFSAVVANGREDLVASFLRSAVNDIHQWNGGSSNHDLLGAVWFVWNYPNFVSESIANYSQVQAAFREQQNLLPAGNPAGYGVCQAAPGGASRTFSDTGRTVSGPFLTTWNNQGGLGVYGFPVQDAGCVKDPRTQRIIWSQWFQRHRMEWHPEYGGVALGAIGSQLAQTRGYNPDDWTPQTKPTGTCELVGPVIGGVQRGKWVCGDILTTWKQYGAAIYGFPVSPEFDHTSAAGTFRSQYFERARLERHANPTRIEGGLLGCEAAGLVGKVLGC